MAWYAVAKGRIPGIYTTWLECEKQVKGFGGAKFHKFNSKGEAEDFIAQVNKEKVDPFGLRSSSQLNSLVPLKMINSNTTPTKLQSVIPCPSSPKLKVSALKQRLSIIEKNYEASMLELRLDLDVVKERIEAFDPEEIDSNERKKLEFSEQFKVLNESLSSLAKQCSDAFQGLKTKISTLKCTIEGVEKEIESNTTQPLVGSMRRNLIHILEPVPPTVSSERSFSESSTSKKGGRKPVNRKRKRTEDEAPPSSSKLVKSNTGFEVDANGYVHVYTDGACTNNGRVGARAGIGVFFANDHPLNYSERVRGRITNNTAEIQAATSAIELAKRAGIEKLLIHTDSEFLINCITVWIHKWKTKQWKKSDGNPVKNKEELIELDKALEGISVKWDHVRGHSGLHGNEMADALARAGAKKRLT